MKILVIDNYDSFTYNLVQIIGNYCKIKPVVRRNDEIVLEDIKKINPNKILISPGPGRPENSKISIEVIKNFGKNIPILGVCLGHQAIGICYGARIIKAKAPIHGKISKINHNQKSVFKNLPQNFEATRYHSLIIDRKSLPDELEITATSEDETIMGVKHKSYPIEGIQFHPESILTTHGSKLIYNWMNS